MQSHGSATCIPQFRWMQQTKSPSKLFAIVLGSRCANIGFSSPCLSSIVVSRRGPRNARSDTTRGRAPVIGCLAFESAWWFIVVSWDGATLSHVTLARAESEPSALVSQDVSLQGYQKSPTRPIDTPPRTKPGTSPTRAFLEGSLVLGFHRAHSATVVTTVAAPAMKVMFAILLNEFR